MNDKSPNFYLSTAGEYRGLAEPRECCEKMRLRDNTRDDYMLVGIAPPLIGQPFGMGGQDIDELILASRLEGFTLYPITRWPVPVYVIRVLDDSIRKEGFFRKDQVEIIAWGTIFPSVQEAKSYAANVA